RCGAVADHVLRRGRECGSLLADVQQEDPVGVLEIEPLQAEVEAGGFRGGGQRRVLPLGGKGRGGGEGERAGGGGRGGASGSAVRGAVRGALPYCPPRRPARCCLRTDPSRSRCRGKGTYAQAAGLVRFLHTCAMSGHTVAALADFVGGRVVGEGSGAILGVS